MMLGLALASIVAGGLTPAAWAGQAEQFIRSSRRYANLWIRSTRRKSFSPDRVKRGQWFDVTVSIGSEGEHPALSEHFIRYIALYINTAEISRVYLHPVYSYPKVTFTIALDEGGSLRALEEPNHSAAWEASKKITVVP